MTIERTIKLNTNADFEIGVRWRSAGTAIQLSDVILSIGASPTPLVANVASGHVTLGNLGDEYRAVVLIPKADLEDLVAGTAPYDLVLERASDGRLREFMQGQAVIEAGAVP